MQHFSGTGRLRLPVVTQARFTDARTNASLATQDLLRKGHLRTPKVLALPAVTSSRSSSCAGFT